MNTKAMDQKSSELIPPPLQTRCLRRSLASRVSGSHGADGLVRGTPPRPDLAEQLDAHGDQRYRDDANGDDREVVLDDRDVAESIAGAHADPDPQHAAEDVVEHEP